jgi:type IV fimbrial biogenesis protein FimT
VLVRRRNGFTLIELMIGIVILAILTLLALPTFRDFRANARIRNTADTILHGVRLAQVEAIRRNENVTLEIDPATGWAIVDLGGTTVMSETFDDPSGQIVIEPTPAGADKLTYTPLGQWVDPNPDDASAALRSIRVTSTAVSAPNELRVTVDPVWGAARVCEPRFVYPADPAGCPAGVP